jgi:periplasmic divalent cation tolerance protein
MAGGFNDSLSTLYCPCPDVETATKIARFLLEARLAACVNIVPGVISLYPWEGTIREDNEVLLLAKTTQPNRPRIMQQLPEHHPYECPCILFFNGDFCNPGYARWVTGNVLP